MKQNAFFIVFEGLSLGEKNWTQALKFIYTVKRNYCLLVFVEVFFQSVFNKYLRKSGPKKRFVFIIHCNLKYLSNACKIWN